MADSWIEISFDVDGELAEAIAEAVSRYVPNGVVVENGIYFKDSDDPGTPTGEVRVFGYIPVNEQLEETKQKIEQAIWFLSRIQPIPEPTYRMIKDQNWMESWKEHYHPIPIGEKLLITPAWVEPPDKTRIPIRIDPSMAFGTGTHPTTQLCLEMIERYTQPQQTVIDVGCGSGVLSIAAIKLGADHAVCVDIDKASVKSTLENAEVNSVKQFLEVGLGSVQEILNGEYSIRQAPLVVVNILAPIILKLFDAGLVELLENNGTLILSGILLDKVERIEAAAKNHNLTEIDRIQKKDWVSITYRK